MSTKSVNPAIGMVVQGVTGLITSSIAKNSAKKQEELNAYLQGLSEKQIAQLDANLKAATNEMERQKVLFQSMAVERNQELIKKTDSKRNISFIVVGVGVFVLGFLIYKSRK
jgi:multidrug resistance efflux pump